MSLGKILVVGSHHDDAELMAGGTLARLGGEILVMTDLGFEDQKFDKYPILVLNQKIEEKIAEYQPETVITHWWGDANQDHAIVNKSVNVACRPTPGHPVKRLLFGEVLSSTEWGAPAFKPTYFVRINFLDKLTALKKYEEKMRHFPHPRSTICLESLARYRGASAGLNAAEAFEIGRWID